MAFLHKHKNIYLLQQKHTHMRKFQFGNVEVFAPTYLEADHQAEIKKLDVLVSDQTFDKLIQMIKRSHNHIEQIETIGGRDIYIITKENDENVTIGIHCAIRKHDDDVCLLSEDQKIRALEFAEEVYEKQLDLYDFDLENIV